MDPRSAWAGVSRVWLCAWESSTSTTPAPNASLSHDAATPANHSTSPPTPLAPPTQQHSLFSALPLPPSCTFAIDLQFSYPDSSSLPPSRTSHSWILSGTINSPNCDVSLELSGHALNYAHFIDRSSRLSLLLLLTSVTNLLFTVRQLSALLSEAFNGKIAHRTLIGPSGSFL